MLVPSQVLLAGTSMQSTMHLFHHISADGKLPSEQLAVTSPSGSSPTSRLFYVTDRTTGTRFLVDTGAGVSVLPPSTSDRCKPAPLTFQAVNQSSYLTFGEKSMTLDIGLCRSYRWIFIIGDIPTPIFGADFLAHFNLEVDVRNRQLLDSITGLSLCGIQSTMPSPHPALQFPAATPYRDLLRNFPDIFRPSYADHLFSAVPNALLLTVYRLRNLYSIICFSLVSLELLTVPGPLLFIWSLNPALVISVGVGIIAL